MAAIALAWLISFALAYRASHALLNPYTTMYVFWDFSFPPVPPRRGADLVRFGGILLEVFVNPLNLVVPDWPAVGAVLPVLLTVLGGISMYRGDRTVFLMVVLPILFAFVASMARRFPFHGRLMLELVPLFYLLIAAGTNWFRTGPGRRAYVVVLVLLLAYPCLSTLYEATGKRFRQFNAHGDLHNNLFMP